MVEFTVAVAMVAPYYNLGMTVIVMYLFVQLFRTYQEGRRVFFPPWGYLFAAVMVFVLETVLTILRQAGLIQIPLHINGFFELVMISLFIYALLLQREWIRTEFGPGPAPAPLDSPATSSQSEQPIKLSKSKSKKSSMP